MNDLKKTPHEIWLEREAELRDQVRDAGEVSVQIPGWSPANLEQGLHWLKASIYEGFYVAHRIDWEGKRATLRFKIWEYGEDEPSW